LTVAAFVAGAFMEDKTSRGVDHDKYQVQELQIK